MSPEALIFPISHFLKDLTHSALFNTCNTSRFRTFTLTRAFMQRINQEKIVIITKQCFNI